MRGNFATAGKMVASSGLACSSARSRRGWGYRPVFASFIDLTKQKDEQVQSKMLISELNHRVRNTLATVQSIVWQAIENEF